MASPRIVVTSPWKLGLFVFLLVVGTGFGLVYAYLELLGGQLPYRADTLGALIKEVMTSVPRPVSELAPEVPPSMVTFVTRAIAREVTHRFQSARDMATNLRSAAESGDHAIGAGEGVEARGPGARWSGAEAHGQPPFRSLTCP